MGERGVAQQVGQRARILGPHRAEQRPAAGAGALGIADVHFGQLRQVQRLGFAFEPLPIDQRGVFGHMAERHGEQLAAAVERSTALAPVAPQRVLDALAHRHRALAQLVFGRVESGPHAHRAEPFIARLLHQAAQFIGLAGRRHHFEQAQAVLHQRLPLLLDGLGRLVGLTDFGQADLQAQMGRRHGPGVEQRLAEQLHRLGRRGAAHVAECGPPMIVAQLAEQAQQHLLRQVGADRTGVAARLRLAPGMKPAAAGRARTQAIDAPGLFDQQLQQARALPGPLAGVVRLQAGLVDRTRQPAMFEGRHALQRRRHFTAGQPLGPALALSEALQLLQLDPGQRLGRGQGLVADRVRFGQLRVQVDRRARRQVQAQQAQQVDQQPGAAGVTQFDDDVTGVDTGLARFRLGLQQRGQHLAVTGGEQATRQRPAEGAGIGGVEHRRLQGLRPGLRRTGHLPGAAQIAARAQQRLQLGHAGAQVQVLQRPRARGARGARLGIEHQRRQAQAGGPGPLQAVEQGPGDALTATAQTNQPRSHDTTQVSARTHQCGGSA